MVADEFAHGEREMTVCAAVLKGDRLAVLSTEEHDGLAKDYSSQRLPANLRVGSGDVPIIPKEHGYLPL
jgi:hypothetical protein